MSKGSRPTDGPHAAATPPRGAGRTDALPGDGLILKLKRAEELIRGRLRPTLESVGLHIEHWQILAVLLVTPGMRMSDLAEAALLAPASLTRHVDKLVERAFVVRRIDVKDKRSLVVALSSMGRSLAEKLTGIEQQARNEYEELRDFRL